RILVIFRIKLEDFLSVHAARRCLERKTGAIFLFHELGTAQMFIESLITCCYSQWPSNFGPCRLIDQLQRIAVAIRILFEFVTFQYPADVRKSRGVEYRLNF